jgi:hypothetical protein
MIALELLHFKETLKILRSGTVTEIVIVVQGRQTEAERNHRPVRRAGTGSENRRHMRLFIQQSRRRDPGIQRTACRHYAPDPSLARGYSHRYIYETPPVLIQAGAVTNNSNKKHVMGFETGRRW